MSKIAPSKVNVAVHSIMANAIVLGFLELVAVSSCLYGFYELSLGKELFGVVGLIYGSLWFFLGAASNICGIFALYLMHFGPEDEISRGSQFWVQYHYLLAWLTIVLGYPTYLIMIWMAHFPSPYDHLHVILALIPLIAWVNRRTKAIVLATQIVSAFSILSHLWISAVAGQIWGLAGALVMIVNVAALSVPTKYNIGGFSSRELYVIGLSATSFIFSQEVAVTVVKPVVVEDLLKFKGY